MFQDKNVNIENNINILKNYLHVFEREREEWVEREISSILYHLVHSPDAHNSQG